MATSLAHACCWAVTLVDRATFTMAILAPPTRIVGVLRLIAETVYIGGGVWYSNSVYG
ncbi:MAG: hypothetical protein ACYC4N_08830 [Pirellulaceae bacterium]